MLTRRRTRAIQGEDEQPYHLDVKRKPKAVGIENNDLEQSKVKQSLIFRTKEGSSKLVFIIKTQF